MSQTPQPATSSSLSSLGIDIGFLGGASLWPHLRVDKRLLNEPKLFTIGAQTNKKAEVFDFCEALPHMVWVSKSDGSFVFSNAWVEQYIGAKITDGEAWANVLHPDDREEALQVWQDNMAQGIPFSREVRLRRHDGQYRWHDSRSMPLYAEDGSIARWVGGATDIQDKKDLQISLLGNDAKLQAVTTNAQLVLWAVDNKGVYTYCEGKGLKNPIFENIEFIGKSVFEIYASEPQICDLIRRALQGHAGSHILSLEHLWWEVFFVPLRDAADNIIGAVGLSMDITPRKASEAARYETARLTALIEAQHRVITGPLDQDIIMRTILDAVIRLCDASSGVIGTRDEDEIAYVIGQGEAQRLQADRLATANCLAGRCLADNRSILVDDL